MRFDRGIETKSRPLSQHVVVAAALPPHIATQAPASLPVARTFPSSGKNCPPVDLGFLRPSVLPLDQAPRSGATPASAIKGDQREGGCHLPAPQPPSPNLVVRTGSAGRNLEWAYWGG
jgi:hypothetical protein